MWSEIDYLMSDPDVQEVQLVADDDRDDWKIATLSEIFYRIVLLHTHLLY